MKIAWFNHSIFTLIKFGQFYFHCIFFPLSLFLNIIYMDLYTVISWVFFSFNCSFPLSFSTYKFELFPFLFLLGYLVLCLFIFRKSAFFFFQFFLSLIIFFNICFYFIFLFQVFKFGFSWCFISLILSIFRHWKVFISTFSFLLQLHKKFPNRCVIIFLLLILVLLCSDQRILFTLFLL